MFFDRKPPVPAVPEDLANLKITDARLRDTLSIAGAAPDFSDLDFTVDRREVFQAGNRQWSELSGTWRDLRVYLEVHSGPVPEVYGFFDGRRLTLDEIGLSEDDLSQMDQRQNQADFFDFENKFWLYRYSRQVNVFNSENPGGRGFYAWQFAEQGGRRFLSVRKFEGEPFFAMIWSQIEPSDITVYRGA
jgi:hypothetical protein